MRQQVSATVILLIVGVAGLGFGAPPANDDCTQATVVTTLPFGESISTTDATQAPDDPQVCAGGGGPTVWYRVIPPSTGTLCVRTCGATAYDSVLAAFDGTCGALGAALTCNDDSCGLRSRITVPVTAGEPILIEVSRYGGFDTLIPGGPLRIDIVDAGDGDGDGVGGCDDNCVEVPNPSQADEDGDEVGNACDSCPAEGFTSDDDGDGFCATCPGGCDNCPWTSNADQADADGDLFGDVCDLCPAVADPDQQNYDGDALGDACDPCPTDASASDADGDGFCSNPTPCPAGCDLCPSTANPDQLDADGDGVGDACDNCPTVPNLNQANWDADPLGNACDSCIEICGGTQCATSGCYDVPTDTCVPSGHLPDGSACNDFDPCTLDDACQAGVCTGPPLDCGEPTTCRPNPTCVPYTGCVGPPEPNGTPCDDGSHCTADDACRLGVCVGTPLDACPVDQYKCYKASGGKPLADAIAYTDALGSTTVARQPASHLCNAATDGGPVEDDRRHLTCWRARQTQTTPRRTLKLKDRFGSGTFTLSKPIAYCAPSEELANPASADLDEYACYRARGPKRAPQALTLTDPFETRGTSVLKPYSVCVPASRGGAPLIDADANLVCYKLKEAPTPELATHAITLSSPLGGEALRTSRRRLLCVPATKEPCAELTFTSVEGAPQCGGPEFNPPSSPPFVGAIYDAAAGGNLIWSLGSGCTYYGGGESQYYPARQQVTGATLTLGADSCTGPEFDLRAIAGAGGGECAFGPVEQRVCLSNPLRSCTVDADCGGPAGNCAPVPRCYAAPPQPFRTSIASVCLMSPLDADTTGTVDPATGAVTLTTTTRTLVYLTGIGSVPYPCPRCINAQCDAGGRAGLPCTVSASPDLTSLDCPPADASFFLSLGPGTQVNSTAPRSLAANASGLFCPNQLHAGAFGVPAARRIELAGLAAGDLRDGLPHPLSLLDLVCIGTTGNAAADQLADFPGPQATSTVWEVQLTQ
jgi:hypothetical protein